MSERQTLDVAIARADGCELWEDGGYWYCMCGRHRDQYASETGQYKLLALYSEDLNATMELVWRRWPDAEVILGPKDVALDLFEDGFFQSVTGSAAAEKLCRAVITAMEAEREQ